MILDGKQNFGGKFDRINQVITENSFFLSLSSRQKKFTGFQRTI